MRGMYGTLNAEFEAQRTIKRAKLTAISLFRGSVGPTTGHVENNRIVYAFRRGET